MKYLFVFLSVILCSCGSAKFVVISETPNGVFNNCVVGLKPITQRSKRLKTDGALVECGTYKVGDTLTLNRKEFTNF